jgi:hypothetical protein
MFCVCVVIAMILVSLLLCCAPLRAFIFVVLLLFLLCVSVFTAFERVLCPPSSVSWPVYCEVMCHLHMVFCFSSPVCCLRTAFVLHLRTRYSNNGYPVDCACVPWGYLLWDLALVLLTLLVYQIARALRETLVFFTQSCLSPWPSKVFSCSEILLFILSFFYLVRGSLEICSFQNDFICPSALFA